MEKIKWKDFFYIHTSPVIIWALKRKESIDLIQIKKLHYAHPMKSPSGMIKRWMQATQLNYLCWHRKPPSVEFAQKEAASHSLRPWIQRQFPFTSHFCVSKVLFLFCLCHARMRKESNSPNKTPLSLKTLQFRSTFYDFPFYVVFPLIFISDLTLWTSNKKRPRQWEHSTKDFAVRRRNVIFKKALKALRKGNSASGNLFPQLENRFSWLSATKYFCNFNFELQHRKFKVKTRWFTDKFQNFFTL